MKPYEAYKDSGVEWIGEMPSGWYLKRLKFFAKICNGHDHKDVNDEGGKYPIYGSGGQFGWANKYIYNKPSVILGRKGTIDKPRYIEEPFWSVDTAYYTRIRERNSPRFFYYLCTTINFELYKYGSAIPSMTQGTLNNIEFCSPSFCEQEAIAAYLDRKTGQLDVLIAQKQRLIALLEEERTALINQAVTKGLDPTVPMKDSGIEWLGDVPAHWEVKKLKYVVEKIGSGVTPKGGAEVYQETGIPLLRSQNIYSDRFKLDNIAYISEDVHKEMRGSQVQSGDVLLNITGGSIGRCFYVTNEFDEANVNQHVCILRPNKDILTKFLHLQLVSAVGQIQISLCQLGGNREAVNFEQLRNFDFAFPDIEEQTIILEKIGISIEYISNLQAKAQQHIALLQEYKTALISEVVTGKVDVRGE